MTGFGSAEGQVQGGRLSLEIRTVNHRYYNPQLKLPLELGGIEGQLRERLRQLLDRGHVTVSARWLEPASGVASGAVTVDLARAKQVVAAAQELKKRLKLKGDVDLAFVARQPDVLNLEADGAAAVTWDDVAPIWRRAARPSPRMGRSASSSVSSRRSCCARRTRSGRRRTTRRSRKP